MTNIDSIRTNEESFNAKDSLQSLKNETKEKNENPFGNFQLVYDHLEFLSWDGHMGKTTTTLIKNTLDENLESFDNNIFTTVWFRYRDKQFRLKFKEIRQESGSIKENKHIFIYNVETKNIIDAGLKERSPKSIAEEIDERIKLLNPRARTLNSIKHYESTPEVE